METISEVLSKRKRAAIIGRAVIIGALTVAILIFTFLDKQVSDAIYMGDNAFMKAFAYIFFAVGYVPAIIVDSMLFACAFCMVKNKGLKVLFAFLTFSTLCGATYTAFESFENVPSIAKFITMGCVGLVATAPILYGISRLNADNLKNLFYIFLIGAIMATLMILVIAPMQQFWGRDRYFAVIAGEGAYTPWYLPQGTDSDIAHRSFPSMHAGSAFSMVVLIILALRMNFPRWLRITLITVAAVILVCVPLSRVVMGWHYMTDVLFGLFISYGLGELGLFIGDKIYRHYSPAAL